MLSCNSVIGPTTLLFHPFCGTEFDIKYLGVKMRFGDIGAKIGSECYLRN
jgi:hypothetical protein